MLNAKKTEEVLGQVKPGRVASVNLMSIAAAKMLTKTVRYSSRHYY